MTRVLEAFAGCGGQALGWHRAGVEHVGLVERDEYAAAVLRRHFPGVPVLSDALALDPAEWRGRVDVLTGGPPCQSASHAGLRKGRADERWLWGWFVDFAAAIEAPLVVAENPPGLFSVENGEGFASILHAFGDHGYAVEWDTLAAGTLGAPHRRERVFIVARRDGKRTWERGGQPSLFPGRPGAWPRAGRWVNGTLTTRERAWPTPSPLPWEVAADAEALPTPRVSADRASRGSMVHNAQWSAPALAQAVELKAGILPREFHSEDELTPQARRMFAEGKRRVALPTPRVIMGNGSGEHGDGGPDLQTAIRRHALPTPSAGQHNYDEDLGQWEARRAELAEKHGNNGAGVPLGIEVRRRALPTPQAHDMKGSPGAAAQSAGGFQSSLPAEVRRRALPTPTRTDGADRDYQTARGPDYPTLGHAAKDAAGVESQMMRRALPTPAARDYRGANSEDSQERRNAGSARGQQLPNELAARGVLPHAGTDDPGRLSPALPEWMLSFPAAWSRLDGPSLADAPSRPYLPDLTAELGLTTVREHRRDRLRCLGNACAVDVAEFIAREVLR